jgi:hypothetical protein
MQSHPWTWVGRYEGADLFAAVSLSKNQRRYTLDVAAHKDGDWRFSERSLPVLPYPTATAMLYENTFTTLTKGLVRSFANGRLNPNGVYAVDIEELTALLAHTGAPSLSGTSMIDSV